MSFVVNAYGLTDVGLVRENNEDYWGVAEEARFYVLADGMGGHRAGEVASREAVTGLCHSIVDKHIMGMKIEDVASFLAQAIMNTNEKIFQMGSCSEEMRGMGTTLCCLHIHPRGAVWAHVGDSRIYLLRQRRLYQMTRDHSLLSDLIDMGQLEAHEASSFQYKNVLTKAIGTDPTVKPNVEISEYKNGDRFLLCSDGLSDLLVKREIEEMMNRNIQVKECCKELVKAALEKGGSDNITVVVIDVHEENDEPEDLS